MWAESVDSQLCSERFFPRYSGFPFSPKTNIWFDLLWFNLICNLLNLLLVKPLCSAKSIETKSDYGILSAQRVFCNILKHLSRNNIKHFKQVAFLPKDSHKKQNFKLMPRQTILDKDKQGTNLVKNLRKRSVTLLFCFLVFEMTNTDAKTFNKLTDH